MATPPHWATETNESRWCDEVRAMCGDPWEHWRNLPPDPEVDRFMEAIRTAVRSSDPIGGIFRALGEGAEESAQERARLCSERIQEKLRASGGVIDPADEWYV